MTSWPRRCPQTPPERNDGISPKGVGTAKDTRLCWPWGHQVRTPQTPLPFWGCSGSAPSPSCVNQGREGPDSSQLGSHPGVWEGKRCSEPSGAPSCTPGPTPGPPSPGWGCCLSPVAPRVSQPRESRWEIIPDAIKMFLDEPQPHLHPPTHGICSGLSPQSRGHPTNSKQLSPKTWSFSASFPAGFRLPGPR